jgi:hypothetical protein
MRIVETTTRKLNPLLYAAIIALTALVPAHAQLAPLDTLPPNVELTSPSIATGIVDDPPVVEQSRAWGLAHSTLGWITVATALATGILNPEVAGRSTHEALGYTSAGLAAATLTTGFIAHHDKVGTGNKNKSNNIHAILGIVGGSMMVLTPFFAPEEAHQVLGEAGALTMAVSVGWKFFF